MLFKRYFVFTLLVLFVLTSQATATENNKVMRKKQETDFLEIKYCFPKVTVGSKSVKEREEAVVSAYESNYLVKLEQSPKELVDEVWQIVYRQYVDPSFNQVDWRGVREKYLRNSYQDYSQAYMEIEKMLSLLDDPWTKFYTPEEFRKLTAFQDKESSISTSIKRNSIKKISVKQDEKTRDSIIAQQLLPDSPAVYGEIKQNNNNKISYIRLNRFDSSTTEAVKKTIEDGESQQVSGYVLDLRSNRGGLLFSAIEVAKMFLSKGNIVKTLSRSENKQFSYDASKKLTDKPLTVLVDRQTASGAEILASALQENDRATLIGEQTNGQGSIQSVRPLSNKSGLAITIASFLTANGNTIEGVGIKPDLLSKPEKAEIIKLRENERLLGTSEDSLYKEALEVLQSKF